MTITVDLLAHAIDLVDDTNARPSYVRLRRGVSSAYYAVYHLLTMTASSLVAPNVPVATRNRIGRWFDHAEMKRICARFAKAQLDQPLRDLIGVSASPELRRVAGTFIKLQEARHNADYDLSYAFSAEEANDYVRLGIRAMKDWSAINNSAEANIFILSLLMWKNWDKERG